MVPALAKIVGYICEGNWAAIITYKVFDSLSYKSIEPLSHPSLNKAKSTPMLVSDFVSHSSNGLALLLVRKA